MPRIMAGHMMLTRWFGPEFAITEPEALELSRAYGEWRSHYGGILDPKTEALISLMTVAVAVEGSRVMACSARKKAEKAAAAASKSAQAMQAAPNVVAMDGLRGV